MHCKCDIPSLLIVQSKVNCKRNDLVVAIKQENCPLVKALYEY